MAKQKKSKKKRLKEQQCSRRCKCPECKTKREGRKWNRRRTTIEQDYANRDKSDRLAVAEGRGGPGFLSGGHQAMKRDYTFEGGFSEALSPLHTKARGLVTTQLKTDLGGGWKLDRAYQLDIDRTAFDNLPSERFQKVDYLWHGTKANYVSAIVHNNLEVRGAHCLLGAGIYLAPSFEKAWGYTGWSYRNKKSYKVVLLCAVRLGKVWQGYTCGNTTWARRCADTGCICKKRPSKAICKSVGADTASANAGLHAVAWGGRLNFSELCCYDAAQVLPVYACVFKQS